MLVITVRILPCITALAPGSYSRASEQDWWAAVTLPELNKRLVSGEDWPTESICLLLWRKQWLRALGGSGYRGFPDKQRVFVHNTSSNTFFQLMYNCKTNILFWKLQYHSCFPNLVTLLLDISGVFPLMAFWKTWKTVNLSWKKKKSYCPVNLT